MYTIYSPEEEAKYGVLGIKIKINVDDLKNNIEKFKPFNEQEEVEKRIMLKYINDFDDVLTRKNEYGHFTSSAFILNKERTKMLMIYHKIYNAWAWTGGHSDGDSDLLYVAMKEAKEETGITSVKPIKDDIYSLEIITVNGHEKRGEYVGSHVHLNTTFLLEADENESIRIKEDENSGVKWVPIDEITKVSSEPWICKRVYQKIIDKMRKDGII
jgi:8-oxo-dGTP pyrophosphatase MutT (NUDIX family)